MENDILEELKSLNHFLIYHIEVIEGGSSSIAVEKNPVQLLFTFKDLTLLQTAIAHWIDDIKVK